MFCATRLFRRGFAPLAALYAAALLVGPLHASAQGPVVLPYTISTAVSSLTAPTAVGAGKLCNGGGTPAAGNTLPVATDSFNDGCPATQAILSASDFRGGVATDPLGNLYVDDTSNLLIRKVDARSGLITVLVGGGTACTSAVDKMGDGCSITQSGVFNNPRGIGADPYGNILIAGYSDQVVHLVCLASSPICSAAQLNTMRVIAGCTTTSASQGTAVIGPDNIAAVTAGTCSSSVGGVDQPRGAGADAFGNVYVADTGNNRYRVVLGPLSYNGVTNPLVAILKLYTGYSSPTPGFIYALFGSQTAAGTQFTVPASGAVCSAGSTAKATDASGDGCPFFNTKVATSSSVQAIGADANGNVFFGDSIGLRVLYAGGTTVQNAILANNATLTTISVGSVYLLAGSGSTNTIGTTPILGTTTSLGSLYKLTLDRLGNVFLGDSSKNAVEFFDMQTGYVREIAGAGTVCTTGATGTPNSIGDGCPATQSSLSGGNGLGVAVDPQGNLYIADIGHVVVRKVSAGGFANTLTGTTTSPGLFIHAQPGTSAITPTSAGGSDFTLGTPACTTNAPGANAGSGDSSFDCVYPVTIKPAGVGLRTDAVSIASTSTATGGSLALTLSSNSVGSEITFDPSSVTASTSSVGTATLAAVAIDGSSNMYVATNGGAIYKGTQGTAGTSIASGLGTISSVTTDTGSNVYYTTGAATIGKLSFTGAATYSSGTIAAAGYTPTSVVSDAAGNLFFYDSTSKAIVRYSPVVGTFVALTTTAFNTVSAVALDHLGNVIVADTGAGAVYRVPVMGGTQTAVTVSGTIVPTGVAVDAANNIYIADAATKSVILVPVTGAQTSIAAATASIMGVAVDALGNLYVADSSVAGVTLVNRSAFSYTFPNTSTYLAGLLTNTGNAASTGFIQSDSANFSLFNTTPAPAATCASGTAPGPGFACTIDASFLPPSSGGGTLTGTVQLGPVANTLGVLTLSATVAGNAVTTTTVITGPTPASPIYAASGTEATFVVTVTASSGTPTGSVNVSIDGGATTAYALTGGTGTTATASVPLSGLIAATHTIAATYPTTGAFNGSSTASATSFTVAQASTAVAWSPSSQTQQYSAAIGTGVFDAYATSGTTVVPGSFVYTATPSGGSATTVDSASYLAIGTYTLAVTFVPTDTVDYTGSAFTLTGSYTVTKASTTSAVGASTSVVAADGTGNFTSVETAVNSLPSTGGSIYLAPGTYKEQVLVAVPNVSMHGLGGNPQSVILTSETGAFGTGTTYAPANPFGFNNDEGSATLVVAKGTVNGTSYTPSNFYLDNISIINTYDTDSTNTNGVTGSNQNCTGVSTMSNNALYVAGNLCASQALTVWITADKSVFNNVRLTSLQDTIAAYNTTGSNAASGIASTSRQYYWKNYITGDIDYVFGDAAAVFDQTQFYTTYHNGSVSGNATVFAQNKAQMTGSANDYLSGYVANNSVFTSQMTSPTITGPMTSLYFGRPYGVYSTTTLINNQVDDVNALGWESFSGANLATASYFEYGTTCTSANCTTTGRETTSAQPEMVSIAMAARYAPTTFLSTPSPDIWNPTGALTTGINSYVPSATSATINYGQSITILARPQVPGGGAIPTGTYTLTDNGASILTGTATGTLDASGAAYLTSSSFAVGTHNIVLTYNGDANFSGSTSSAFVLTVNGTSTTTTLAVTTTNPVYGQSVTVTATVAAASGATPAGTVNLSVDGGASINATIANGVATYTLINLGAGAHTLSASYVANGADTASMGTGSVTLAKAVLTVAAGSASRAYQAANPAFTYTVSGYQYSDTSSSFTGAPSITSSATPNSPAGTYPVTPALGSLASANYSFAFTSGALTVNGGAGQKVILGAIPNLPNGTTAAPLFGRATSGLPVTYTVTGPATITTTSSGSTITVNGTGTVTVTAAQSGNATFAAATSVSRSFTAQ